MVQSYESYELSQQLKYEDEWLRMLRVAREVIRIAMGLILIRLVAALNENKYLG